MVSTTNLSDITALGSNDPMYKEFFGDIRWRILPEDALPEDKFQCDMVLIRTDSEMFAGHTVAHGYVYNDSRGVFPDGERVRTSYIVNIYEKGGHSIIETRNTMYRLIERSE